MRLRLTLQVISYSNMTQTFFPKFCTVLRQLRIFSKIANYKPQIMILFSLNASSALKEGFSEIYCRTSRTLVNFGYPHVFNIAEAAARSSNNA